MTITLRTFSSIGEVPTDAWDRLAPRDSAGLESSHLRALETSCINDLHPWYVVGYAEGAPVGHRAHAQGASMAAVTKALEIMVGQPELRERLLANPRFLAGGLADLGFETANRGGPIVQLYCGEELLTIGLYHKLFDDGVFVNPVVSPAAPRGASCCASA